MYLELFHMLLVCNHVTSLIQQQRVEYLKSRNGKYGFKQHWDFYCVKNRANANSIIDI